MPLDESKAILYLNLSREQRDAIYHILESEIAQIEDDLDDEDANSHIWWNRFREFLEIRLSKKA